ncbi:MAG: LytR C-terminal domain-containing protein [Firmicutes bacterium]|nr:LytR C-terminal domain-containing protein [Bacillota bacterium]
MTKVTIVNTMAGMIKTDMDVSTIASLATQFRGMNVDTDVMAGMEPTTSQYKNDTWYEICQTSAWRKMMSRVDQGLSPYESDADDPARGVSAQDSGAAATGEAGATKAREGASASDAPTYSGSVLVLNASMTDGAAGKVATTLKNRGFTATADTAAARESTTKVIYNGDGARSSALGVAQTLGGGVMPQANDGSCRTDVPVIVILGGDSY